MKNQKLLLLLLIILFINTNYGQFEFNTHILSTSIFSAQNIIAEDMDTDGDLDIISCGESLIWWQNPGHGLTNFTEHVITDQHGIIITARPNDYDNDGDIDIIAAHYDNSTIILWINDGHQNFTSQIVMENFVGAHDAVIADMNNDGFKDIIASRGDPDNNGQIVYLMQNSDGELTQQNIYEGDFCHSIDVADFNADSKPDIVSSHVNTGVKVFLQGENNTFNESSFSLPNAYFVRSVDLDNDGDLDVLSAALSYSVYYLKNNGDATFSASFLTYDFALFLHACDIDGNGHTDILFSDMATRKFKILSNNGDNTFTKYTLPGTDQGASGVFAADIDNDNDIDLLTTNWNSNSQIKIWDNQMIVDAIEKDKSLPNQMTLLQNYPNPFNPSTTIRYGIPAVDALSPVEVHVSLRVYDILGNKVATLYNGPKSPGNYEVNWNATNYPSGTYFAILNIDGNITANKMLLIK